MQPDLTQGSDLTAAQILGKGFVLNQCGPIKVESLPMGTREAHLCWFNL